MRFSLVNIRLLMCSQSPRAWADSCAQPKQWTKDMRFGAWNVRSLCMSGSLPIVARKLGRYRLDLVVVVGQRRYCKSRGLYFFLWKRKRKSRGNRIFGIPQNGRVLFVTNRLSYVVRSLV
jgi:hypothetical protein